MAPPSSLWSAIADPFREFFTRDTFRSSLELLAFMLLYKLGDTMATAIISTFYLDVGFTLTEPVHAKIRAELDARKAKG